MPDNSAALGVTRRPIPSPSGLASWALAVGGVAGGVVAASIAIRVPGYRPSLSSGWGLTLLLLPGCALLLTGMVVVARTKDPEASPTSGAGLLLQVAGILWFLAAWNDPATGAAVFVVGRLASWLCPVVAVHGLLRWQDGRRRTELVAVALGYLSTGVLGGLLPVLFFEPRQVGCRDCPADPLLVAHLPTLAVAAGWVAVCGGAAWSLLLIVAQLDRLRRWSPVRRRFDGATVLAVVCICLTVLTASLVTLASAGSDPAGFDDRLWVAFGVALTMAAAASTWPQVAGRLTRIRVTKLAVEAGSVGSDLSDTLRGMLGEPALCLLYPVGAGELVGVDGRQDRRFDSPDTTMTRLERGGSTVAYLAHRSTVDLGGRVIHEITRATRLMLDSERLRAEHSWHLRELQESRRRIVAASDRARRGLERNLHDGAQQNLAGLAIALSTAELRAADADRALLLHRSANLVRAALVELRLVARGIFPRELGDEGLGVALDLLAESAASAVKITVALSGRLPFPIESAAYFAIRGVLAGQLDGTAGPADVDVGLRLRPEPNGRSAADPCGTEWLVVDIRTDKAPPNLTTIEDRVGAVGGGLLRTHPDCTRLRLEIPCAS